eukprot:1322712-Pyramimonas_sp.AAC.1
MSALRWDLDLRSSLPRARRTCSESVRKYKARRPTPACARRSVSRLDRGSGLDWEHTRAYKQS